jgi:hypothetical protein
MKIRSPLTVLPALTLVAGLLLAPVHAAEKPRDPLTPKEAGQLRDAAQMPEARAKLFLDFARARLEASEKTLADSNLQQPQLVSELRGLLYDFAEIIDELDDNLDDFDDHGADLRAALRAVIESEGEFQERLRKIRETPRAAVLQGVNGELEDAMEAVNDSATSSRAMLDNQNKTKEKATSTSH